MSFADIVGLIGGIGGLGALGGLFRIRSTNRQLTAQAKKADAESIDILTGAAADLVAPLRATLAETRSELAAMENQVRELTREVEHLRSELEHERRLSNDNVLKLEVANRRADYYQNLIENKAQGH